MKEGNIMKLRSTLVVLICLLSIAVLSHSDSPPANTIPIISMKTGQGPTCDDITLDNLCMLLGNNFDGIWVEGWLTGHVATPAELCDSTGATMVLAPSRLQALNNVPSDRWGRYTPANIDSVNAFIHPDTMDFKLIADSAAADSILSVIEDRCEGLHDQASGYSCIWYYDIFNEAPARQLSSMLNDTSSVDDYFPSMYSQDTSMTEVLTSGIFSWEKWKSDELYGEDGPTVSVCHSMLHTIDSLEWAGYGGIHLGNCTTQANSVNAYFDMEYMDYDGTPPYTLNSNTPERMDLNSYPVRLAGYYWQTVTADSITVLGSATDLWMLEHYELLMDSTFIPAGDHESGPFPINYHPQAFGRTGGTAIWKIVTQPAPDTTINYDPYSYRIPSPGEFRMLCNIGLLRGAKGVFPYAIRSNR